MKLNRARPHKLGLVESEPIYAHLEHTLRLLLAVSPELKNLSANAVVSEYAG